MSLYYKDPKIEFKKVNFSNNDYLYIYIDDPNLEEDDKISWVYIELLNFYMKKDGKTLSLGNHLGIIYTLNGYSNSMIKSWTTKIKTTINFP